MRNGWMGIGMGLNCSHCRLHLSMRTGACAGRPVKGDSFNDLDIYEPASRWWVREWPLGSEVTVHINTSKTLAINSCNHHLCYRLSVYANKMYLICGRQLFISCWVIGFYLFPKSPLILPSQLNSCGLSIWIMGMDQCSLSRSPRTVGHQIVLSQCYYIGYANLVREFSITM